MGATNMNYEDDESLEELIIGLHIKVSKLKNLTLWTLICVAGLLGASWFGL